MKLFDIDERLAACVKLDESRVVDTENGEIIDLEAIAALEAVEFDAKCIGDVPEEFLKFKDPELDKVAVKKAIKAGETVPGCELVARQNLQIK